MREFAAAIVLVQTQRERNPGGGSWTPDCLMADNGVPMKIDVLRANEHRGRIVVRVEDRETAVEVELSRGESLELIAELADRIATLDNAAREPALSASST